MANTINIEFYSQLLDSMGKNIHHFNGLVDRERAAKEEAQRYAAELENSVAAKDATIVNLNGQIAQMQTGLETAEQAALAELAQKVEMLNDAISEVLSPTANPAPETNPPSIEEFPAPEVEHAEESHDSLDEETEV
ncbi:MAG: hypothetical protein KME13_25285 [Myxacorys californica WJT36-NPBG1]|jgi:uncharacterized coiled-coil protein SlyX|nr:hypothetical protein [Myxacorys californica WJT36-NPBG1]